MEYPTVGAAGSAARADAAASAGVLVSAPAYAPAIVPPSMPRMRPTTTAMAPTSESAPATTSIVGQPRRSDEKKWVPETTPTVYVKSTRPNVPMTSGISRSTSAEAAHAETPRAANSTAAGPRCTPLTRTWPSAAPNASNTARRRRGCSARRVKIELTR